MKISLTYFKQSGKYYTSGEYNTQIPLHTIGVANMYGITDEVKAMRELGKLPGVTDGSNFFIVINCDEGYPVLIHPLKDVE